MPAAASADTFRATLPATPYCADNPKDGIFKRALNSALRKRHVQFNGGNSYVWMLHDIDRRDAYFAHRDADLPEPNVIMVNKQNGHAHAGVMLKVPIAKHDAARREPLEYFADIERGYARRLSADRSYVGLIAKNPLHPEWKVEWRRPEPYTLEELREPLTKADVRKDPTPQTTHGAGRNVTVFNDLRGIAYREVLPMKRKGGTRGEWKLRCEALAEGLNKQFPEPLGLKEVRDIAKSVAYWTWEHFTEEAFSKIQRVRIQRRWSGHVAESTTKPWEVMGISRITYYRRKREGKLQVPTLIRAEAAHVA